MPGMLGQYGLAGQRFPPSFVSTLDDMEPKLVPGDVTLSVQCQCEQCSFKVVVSVSREVGPPVLRCYCRACRKYHASAFASYLRVSRDACDVGDDWTFGDCARRSRGTCLALGTVERVFCQRCFSKIATIPRHGSQKDDVLLSLGCVQDASVPDFLAKWWQRHFTDVDPGAQAPWWGVVSSPADPEEGADCAIVAEGGCSCGSCVFSAAFGPGFFLQHCYCSLCRHLSGSACQTWVPCRKNELCWLQESSKVLNRFSSHAQRHLCNRCGGVLAIVYDAEPDNIWMAAGTLNDSDFVEDFAAHGCTVVHICCTMMQGWYRLPLDGQRRLRYAS